MLTRSLLPGPGLLLTLLTLGCADDFLDRRPLVQQTADTFFTTEQHAVQATNATYQMLREWQVHVFSYIGMTDIVSDDADKGSTPNDATFLREIDDFTLDAANLGPSSVWEGYYNGIYRANVAVQRIPDIEMDEALRDRLVAENRCIRGYFYFNLVRWFGGVPLVLEPLAADEFEQPRASVDAVYAQIIDDLEAAAAVLPEKSDSSAADLGRVTRGTALGLLTKVYLTRERWDDARERGEQLIASGEYSLMPSFNEIFLPSGEHGSESIFEVSTVTLGTGGGGSQFNEVQGVRGTPNLGWGFNSPSLDLLAAFPPNDPRRDATVLTEGEVLPDGSAVIVGDPGVPNQRVSQKAWAPQPTSGGNGNGGGNIRLLRYADVLLMTAEAYVELGDVERGLELANEVRDRARGNLPVRFFPAIEASTQDEARQAVWLERRLELAMEQQRWFDLVRQGRAEERLLAVGKDNFRAGKHELFPIPQAEVDLSGGALQQNPGYE